MDENKKNKKEKDLLNAGVAGAAYEKVQRYGSAAKQHYVAYSGEDNELGKKLVKGLKQISEEKVNPDYEYQNIHQQAGFSAEVKDVARKNAEKIIKGDSTRKIRTDDLGNVNDPLYDTVTIDAEGNVIDGTGAQMKFLGASQTDPTGEGNAARALKKLQSKKFQKYLDADAKIDVPSDQYDKIIQEANDKIDGLSKQLENQKQAGNSEQVKKLQERIDKLEKIKKNLRKSNVSSDEAVFARLHPKLSTAMDVAKISHRAGIQTAKTSAILGGSVSIVKNIVAVCKGEEEAEEAVKNVAKDTATTAAVGYGTGFTGAAIKGAMQNSKSQYVRALSKTNVAGTIVTVTVSAAKTMTRYFKGEIDGVECLETLGEQGTGMIASSMFAVIGQTVIPIPVVGGLIGGMVGYALSSATYGVLVGSLKEAKLAREERIAIEQACEEHIKMIREYRAQMNDIINEYLSETTEIFNESFSGIKDALAIGDIDLLIESSNAITVAFGGNKPFETMDEFNDKMLSGETFKL
ncbi:hypothetical protein [Eubacterium oxidoreducens]|uniref:Uncharacterized protein n=1 Tax=Eubacterium oxidoreducens TaxID=1732 RepID=A0A1G6BDI7_EUBOX|nr:hypothetical protein [Eubacterium oxidoreducens]SDB18700.1 hypothetical protein SAMN02910417_01419 [Eubacterium oxidoreducens]